MKVDHFTWSVQYFFPLVGLALAFFFYNSTGTVAAHFCLPPLFMLLLHWDSKGERAEFVQIFDDKSSAESFMNVILITQMLALPHSRFCS